jgi:hypothetical protein
MWKHASKGMQRNSTALQRIEKMLVLRENASLADDEIWLSSSSLN